MKTQLHKSFCSSLIMMSFFLIALLYVEHISAQGAFHTVIQLGFTGGSTAKAEPHPQGGYMALGWGNSWNQGDKTILIRYTENGDTLWTKTYYKYAGLGNRGPIDIAAASDNSGFFVLIWHNIIQYANPLGNSLLKVDLEGDSLWQVPVTEFPDWAGSGLRSVIATPDGGCILSGANAWRNARILKKISPEGEIEWTNQSVTDIWPYWAQTALGENGTYFASGLASGWQPGPNDSRLAIIKTDASGNTIWEKSFNSGNTSTGDSIRSEGFGVVALSDGGCIVSGKISNPGSFNGPALLMRLNEDGDTVWTKKYYDNPGSTSVAYKIEPLQNGEYLVFMREYEGTSSARGRIMKINDSGDSLWTQHGYYYWVGMSGVSSDGAVRITGGHDAYGYFIKTALDGTYLGPSLKTPWNGQTNLGGPTHFWWDEAGPQQNTSYYQLQLATDADFNTIVFNQSNIEGNTYDVYDLGSFTDYYWRTRAYGPEGGYGMWSAVFHFITGEIVGTDEAAERESFSVNQNFPNPADNKTMIVIKLDREEEAELILTDVLGNIVFTESRSFSSGAQSFEIDVNDLRSGIYFYTIKTSKGKLTKAMCVAHY